MVDLGGYVIILTRKDAKIKLFGEYCLPVRLSSLSAADSLVNNRDLS